MDVVEFKQLLNKFPIVRSKDTVLPPQVPKHIYKHIAESLTCFFSQAATRGILDMFAGTPSTTSQTSDSTAGALRLPSSAEYAAKRSRSAVRDPADAAVMAWCTAAGMTTTKAAEVTREFRKVMAAVQDSMNVDDAELLATSLLSKATDRDKTTHTAQ